jgi:hypothetical protein
MEAKNRSNEPVMVVEGMEDIIKKDLGAHKIILERTQQELLAYRNAVSGEIQKKKYYLTLIGGDKFNDNSLRNSINDINVNIKHMSDKVKLSKDKIEHETLIVDTLTEQLANQNHNLQVLAKHRLRESLDKITENRKKDILNGSAS